MPQHTFRRSDAQPMEPGVPTLVSFALMPTSYLLKKGQRIRLSVGGADRDHFATLPPLKHTLTIHTGAQYPSELNLPTPSEDDIHSPSAVATLFSQASPDRAPFPSPKSD